MADAAMLRLHHQVQKTNNGGLKKEKGMEERMVVVTAATWPVVMETCPAVKHNRITNSINNLKLLGSRLASCTVSV